VIVSAAVLALTAVALLTGPTTAPGFTTTDPRIDEGSGMVVSLAHPHTVWIVNDSGDPARLFAVDTVDGHTRGVVKLAGAKNVDWEALAISPGPGEPQLWVGDVGDNDARRPWVTVYRFDEPTTLSGSVTSWTSYDLVYPDGAHDAETLLVDPRDDRLYVVTKGLLGGSVYAAPTILKSDHVNHLSRIGSAPLLITDGSFRAAGSVVLRNYLTGFERPTVTGRDHRFAIPMQRQGETLAVIAPGHEANVGSEGAGTAVLRIALPSLLGVTPAAPPAARPPGGSALEPTGAVVVILLLGLGSVGFVVWSARRRRRQA
jgi:hypothetical protein